MDCCKPVKNSKRIEDKKISSKEIIKDHKKDKYFSYLSSLSGASGAFSSYQVCHSICLGIVALLSLIGITLTGLPLLFLQKLALPLWIIALVLFAVSIILYIKHKDCMPKNLLIFNFGAIIVGIPFENLAFLRTYFFIIGFSIIIFSLYLIVKKRFEVKYEKI